MRLVVLDDLRGAVVALLVAVGEDAAAESLRLVPADVLAGEAAELFGGNKDDIPPLIPCTVSPPSCATMAVA